MTLYTSTSPVTATPMTWGGYCHVHNIRPQDRPRSEARGYQICLAVGAYAWLRKKDFDVIYKEWKP